MHQGARIRALREARGLTQEQVAEAVGVTGRAVRSYESGVSTPRRSHLEALAKVLGVAPAALVDHDVDDPASFVHALLSLEGTGADPRPLRTGEGVAVLLGGAHGRAVEDWADMRDALAAGEVDDAAYARWRDRYGVGEGAEGAE